MTNDRCVSSSLLHPQFVYNYGDNGDTDEEPVNYGTIILRCPKGLPPFIDNQGASPTLELPTSINLNASGNILPFIPYVYQASPHALNCQSGLTTCNNFIHPFVYAIAPVQQSGYPENFMAFASTALPSGNTHLNASDIQQSVNSFNQPQMAKLCKSIEPLTPEYGRGLIPCYQTDHPATPSEPLPPPLSVVQNFLYCVDESDCEKRDESTPSKSFHPSGLQRLSVGPREGRRNGASKCWTNPDWPLDSAILDKSRFFVIKSNTEDDVHRSVKYGIWCSTAAGNCRLDAAYRERMLRKSNGCVFLFFSVNESLHFCGIAKMLSKVDHSFRTTVWMEDHWKGKIEIEWIYVKDVPNSALRHIFLPNNDSKPITSSRDTQEVLLHQAKQFIKVFHEFKHDSCLFDDFQHYERRQIEQNTLRRRLAANRTRMSVLSPARNAAVKNALSAHHFEQGAPNRNGHHKQKTFVRQKDGTTGYLL